MTLIKLDTTPANLHPEFTRFGFVLLEGAVHRRDDGLAFQFRCLDSEDIPHPPDEAVKAGLAEERVNILTFRRGQTLDVLVVPSHTLNGQLGSATGNTSEVGIETLVSA